MDVGVLVGTGVGVVAGAVGGTVVDDENVRLGSVLADSAVGRDSISL